MKRETYFRRSRFMFLCNERFRNIFRSLWNPSVESILKFLKCSFSIRASIYFNNKISLFCLRLKIDLHYRKSQNINLLIVCSIVFGIAKKLLAWRRLFYKFKSDYGWKKKEEIEKLRSHFKVLSFSQVSKFQISSNFEFPNSQAQNLRCPKRPTSQI